MFFLKFENSFLQKTYYILKLKYKSDLKEDFKCGIQQKITEF